MVEAHPLKHVVILCHPELESFNAAVADTYCKVVRENGQEVVLRDLYRMHFDPLLKTTEQPESSRFELSPDVEQEIALIADAAVVVLIYPIWFGTPPAMLKGYVDRVLGSGLTHYNVRFGKKHSILAGAHLRSFTSSGNSKVWLEEQGAWVSLVNVFDHYLKKAFSMASTDHVHFSSIVSGMSDRFLLQNLQEAEEAARKICSIVTSERHHEETGAILAASAEVQPLTS